MKPVNFPQANRVLKAPRGMEKECGDLHTFSDGVNCISCWQPTEEEIAAIAAGQPIYLLVVSGHTQPPVSVMATSPFITPEEAKR